MLTFVGHQTLRWLLSAGALAVSARQTCRVATTCSPSPTAAATRLIDHEDHQNEGQVNASHVQTRARKRDCVIGLIWVSDRITCRGPSVSRALARCDGLGWGIPTEVSNAQSDDRTLGFTLGESEQSERYFLTYCRRMGANKLFLDGGEPALRFAVWAPNANDVRVVRAGEQSFAPTRRECRRHRRSRSLEALLHDARRAARLVQCPSFA